MKQLFLLAFVFVFSFMGCSKTEDNPTGTNNNNNTGIGSMTAQFKGQSWSGVAFGDRDSSGGTPVLIIGGQRQSDLSSMFIKLYEIDKPGVYNLALSKDDGHQGILNFNMTAYYAETGVVNLTKLTATSAEGTYSFTGKNLMTKETVEISSGTFKVTIDK